MGRQFQGTLHLIGMEWQSGKPPATFTVQCTCNFRFPVDANERGQVVCPVCSASSAFFLLWVAWHCLPGDMMVLPYYEKLAALKPQLVALVEKIGREDAKREAAGKGIDEWALLTLKRLGRLLSCQSTKAKTTATKT